MHDRGLDSVAVLGAGGTMGIGMAANLAAAGFEVRAWNRSAEKLSGLARSSGIAICAEAAEAVRGATAILTMLSDADAVIEVMEDGVAASAEAGTIWLQMGTIGIAGAGRCAELAEREELALVDAPVLGSKQPAEAGELVVLASGPQELRERVAPAFEAIGKRTLWLGEAGAGSRLKVAINSWIVAVTEGTAETVALAQGLGVDPELVLEALSGGPLDLPYMRVKATAMLERDFTPSFRLALAAKDAGLAVEGAREVGLELPMLEAIAARMAAAAEQHGDEDMGATYLESAPAD